MEAWATTTGYRRPVSARGRYVGCDLQTSLNGHEGAGQNEAVRYWIIFGSGAAWAIYAGLGLGYGLAATLVGFLVAWFTTRREIVKDDGWAEPGAQEPHEPDDFPLLYG